MMKTMKKNILAFFLITSLFGNITNAQQKVLNMPVCCLDPFKAVDVRYELQENDRGTMKNTPWVVFSDRDADFGQKYYVTKEEGEFVYICTAQSVDGNKLMGAGKIEKRLKTELMVRYSAELLNKAVIHKKCVVLNKEEDLEKILQGNMSEANIPLYIGPKATTPSDSIPLYFMYFIYKTEGSRFLIGRDYEYDRTKSYEEQIFGWVDTSRVFKYNSRICFEPNYEQQAVKERRCERGLSAKVYENWDADKEKFVGDIVWTEPAHYYLFNSDGKDSSVIKKRVDSLCQMPANSPEFSSLFEVDYLNGLKFRFPLIKAKNDNVFMLGCTGRFDESRLLKDERCRKLEENKRNLNISLIIDHNLKITKQAYFLEQINKKGVDFSKQYGVCIFPRPNFDDIRLPAGNNYEVTRDYIKNYMPGTDIQSGDNCLLTLDYILGKENELDPLETNVYILLNTSKVPQVSETSEIFKRLVKNIVNKNCYIIAFDYSENSGLIEQLKTIMLKAANSYATRYSIGIKPAFLPPQNNIFTLGNSGILAVLTAGKPGSGVVSQVESFIPVALEDILKTVNDAISFHCSNTGGTIKRESPFAKVIGEMEKDAVILSVRAMQEGYSLLKVLDNKECGHNMWKAEVLMTEKELGELKSLMEQYSKVGTSASDQADNIYELWIALSNRFVGEKLDETTLLDMTPQKVMQEMVGGYFGYSGSDELKGYSLRLIREQDPAIQKYFPLYIAKVNRCKEDLEKILETKILEFKNTRDDREEKSNISYFWVPIDLLP
jgi:hypothetical protein